MSFESSFPLDQALLGFLMQNPTHGYALYQRAEAELGRVWYMGMSNVYGTLKALEVDGRVESSRDEDSYPPRTVYRTTAKGRESFLAWVREPVPAIRDMRVELLAKLYFFTALNLDEMETFLDAQEALCKERLEELEQRTAEDPKEGFGRLVSDFRRHRIHATLDWLRALERE